MNTQGMNMAPEWGAALLAWPSLLALALIFGSATLSAALWSRTVDGAQASDALARTLTRPWRILALVAFAFAPFMLLNTCAGMADCSWREAVPFVGEVLGQTHAGHVWEWRLPVTLALLIVAWIPMREFIRALVLSLLCTTLLLMGSLTSHAIDHGATAVAVHLVHQLAAGLWAGSLFACWVGGRQTSLAGDFTVKAATMVSRLAAWSVSILVVTGIYIAYQGLGLSLYQLLYSNYGRVLMIKLAAFAAVLPVGGYNRYFLIPVLERAPARGAVIRNVGGESLIMVGILALAALLANTPPARMGTPMPMPMTELPAPTRPAARPPALRAAPSVAIRRKPWPVIAARAPRLDSNQTDFPTTSASRFETVHPGRSLRQLPYDNAGTHLYEGLGVVKSVDPRSGWIIIDHKEIFGFMAATVMGYT